MPEESKFLKKCHMNKKEIKPMKAFWTAFLAGVVFVFLMILILGGGEILGSPSGFTLIIELCIECGTVFGCVFGLMSWVAKRNQKMNEKDDINDLMRQYLEKKLREENEN